MSDEQSTTQEPTSTPEPPAPKWGDPISEERQAELQGILHAWDALGADHGNKKGPFADKSLTGADVYWLAERVRDERGEVPNLHLERAYLRQAHLEGANLIMAHLEGAFLFQAHLEGADLGGAHLEGAHLYQAQLKGASLGAAYLEGATLLGAHLEGTDLGGASLDGKTNLSEATLDRKTRLGDIQWSGVGNVNLTRINWERVPTLGDEREADFRAGVEKHEAVVRAYRQVAAQVRAQGLSEVADRFSHRAQSRQRGVLRRRALGAWRRPWLLPGAIGRYFGSLFLAVLAGNGYRPERTIFWYLAVVLGFAFAYLHFGLINGHPFAPDEALVFSLTSFHGRGFFPGMFSLKDLAIKLAAAEAVIGLLIEISFIATFTQRFFGAK